MACPYPSVECPRTTIIESATYSTSVGLGNFFSISISFLVFQMAQMRPANINILNQVWYWQFMRQPTLHGVCYRDISMEVAIYRMIGPSKNLLKGNPHKESQVAPYLFAAYQL
jgi:hypothetical protein